MAELDYLNRLYKKHLSHDLGRKVCETRCIAFKLVQPEQDAWP